MGRAALEGVKDLRVEGQKTVALSSKPTLPEVDLSMLPKELQPAFVRPQLAQQSEFAPEGAGWLHELKLDGYRMQARKSGSRIQMLTRSGIDWTHRVPAIAEAVANLGHDAVTLDGEVVVLAPDGTTSFAALQASFEHGARNQLTYFVFDLLHLDGHNTRELGLGDRKRMLAEIIPSAESIHLRLSEHLDSNGKAMFHRACELHAEGIVSKRGDSKYTSGRGTTWLKMKCLHVQEFVVGGFTLPSNGGAGIGALLLGYYVNKKLFYAGRTGTGFTQESSRHLRERLEELRRKEPPFDKLRAASYRRTVWLTPTLVAQVRFAKWTADNQLRHAVFLGLRDDKPAAEVVKEVSAPTPKRLNHAARPRTVRARETVQIRLTHPDKILDPETKITKKQLAEYLWSAAPRILPYLADRPLSIVRCPDGVTGEQFYQRHTSMTLPEGLGSILIPNRKTGKPEAYLTLNTSEALASLAQMSAVELHPWGSSNHDIEHPDRVVIDLDPDESLSWTTVTAAALEVRTFLHTLGLESFVKTTGGKGLHVVLAIERTLNWPDAKDFTRALVTMLERRNPRLYLTKMNRAARAGKIYLDYQRNERGATAVAPYSTRARPGMGVAVPLAWSELTGAVRPAFRLVDFPEWSGRLQSPDPWKDLGKKSQAITTAALAAVGFKPTKT